MKKSSKQKINLHNISVTCITCNNKHNIETTLKKDFKINVCSKCHPFYLGTQKFESKAGRMERFRKLQKKTQELQQKIKNKKMNQKENQKTTTDNIEIKEKKEEIKGEEKKNV